MKLRTHTHHARARASRAAFTLIELLLVIAILAVLAAIVVPKFSGRTEQARVTAAQTQISSFSTALDAFEVDNGFYPRGNKGLDELLTQPSDLTSWKGPYIKDVPRDPWQNEYQYEAPGKFNPSSYDLISAGPDKQFGTDDDIGNFPTAR
jgi:general secretion pathway protein G